MARPLQVAVVGYNEDSCTEVAREAAYRVGREVAKRGWVVVCGGLGGVMKAACRGAHDEGGFCLGIVPSADLSQANAYCDVVVASGLGMSRDFLVAYSGDGMVVVGGGAGTLIEVAAAYQARKPIVAVRGTGGVADERAGKHLDERRTAKVLEGRDPEDAVGRLARALSGDAAASRTHRRREER